MQHNIMNKSLDAIRECQLYGRLYRWKELRGRHVYVTSHRGNNYMIPLPVSNYKFTDVGFR